MVDPEVAYTVEDAAALERVIEALGERFRVESRRVVRERLYYDTFDWRLWRRKSRLWRQPAAGGWRLRWHFEGRRRPCSLALGPDFSPDRIAFASDLPAGSFRDQLAEVIAVRRLLPVVDVRAEGLALRVLDGRRKTVARVLAEVPGARAPGSRGRRTRLQPILIVTPVLGYRAEHRRVVRFFSKELGLGEWDADEFEAASYLGGFGPAGDYASKPSLQLDAAADADSSLRRVLRALLETLERNEAGILAALDTEFLHDFRVAVRRTRSALSLTKRVWPREASRHLRRELSWLGGVTGPARDLDVYLLELPELAASLPDSARGDLEPLRRLLEAKRKEEQRKLTAVLRSARYRRLIDSWREFAGTAPPEESRPDAAREPVPRLATRVIAKAHRRVLKRGQTIDDDSPAAALHALRLDCKKLRYALELFGSLFPRTEIDRLIKALKALQENLGAFNDYGVQQRMLGGFALELGSGDAADLQAVVALGRLVGELEKGEARERSRFSKRFARFSSQKTSERFRALFSRAESA